MSAARPRTGSLPVQHRTGKLSVRRHSSISLQRSKFYVKRMAVKNKRQRLPLYQCWYFLGGTSRQHN